MDDVLLLLVQLAKLMQHSLVLLEHLNASLKERHMDPISQADFQAALDAEGVDIATISTGVTGLVSAVDTLIANYAPGAPSPDFKAAMDAVTAQRASLAAVLGSVTAETQKVTDTVVPPVV